MTVKAVFFSQDLASFGRRGTDNIHQRSRVARPGSACRPRRFSTLLDVDPKTQQMLHLWLHLKSDNWVRWREVQDQRGVGITAAAAGGGATPNAAELAPAGARTNAPGANRKQQPGGGGGGGARLSRRNSGHGASRGTARSQQDGGGAAAASSSGKNGGISKTRSGGSSSAGRGEGGAAGAGGIKAKRVRYRLDGDHDRVLADWEGPARKALQVRPAVEGLLLSPVGRVPVSGRFGTR